METGKNKVSDYLMLNNEIKNNDLSLICNKLCKLDQFHHMDHGHNFICIIK